MNIDELFKHSNSFAHLKTQLAEIPHEQVPIAVQVTVNAFLAGLGELLATTLSADTFLLHSVVFDESPNVFFTVVVMLGVVGLPIITPPFSCNLRFHYNSDTRELALLEY